MSADPIWLFCEWIGVKWVGVEWRGKWRVDVLSKQSAFRKPARGSDPDRILAKTPAKPNQLAKLYEFPIRSGTVQDGRQWLPNCVLNLKIKVDGTILPPPPPPARAGLPPKLQPRPVGLQSYTNYQSALAL